MGYVEVQVQTNECGMERTDWGRGDEAGQKDGEG